LPVLVEQAGDRGIGDIGIRFYLQHREIAEPREAVIAVVFAVGNRQPRIDHEVFRRIHRARIYHRGEMVGGREPLRPERHRVLRPLHRQLSD
jgi:hypothetical protein